VARAPHSRSGRSGATPGRRFHRFGARRADRHCRHSLLQACRTALFTAALGLCWLVPGASLTLFAALLTAGMLSLLAAELAGQLRVQHRWALALTVWAAALGAMLRAVEAAGSGAPPPGGG
jgi:hypothetical protein